MKRAYLHRAARCCACGVALDPQQAPGEQTSPGAGPVIVVETEKGTFEFETYPNEAPKTVAHIVGLINKRFYNGQRVHRVVPGFVMQFGDQQTRDMTKKKMWGRGEAARRSASRSSRRCARTCSGAVAWRTTAMRRRPTRQFYVTLADTPRLDMTVRGVREGDFRHGRRRQTQVRRPNRQSNRARGKVATMPASSGKRSTSSAGIRAVTGSSSIFFSVAALATDCAEK